MSRVIRRLNFDEPQLDVNSAPPPTQPINVFFTEEALTQMVIQNPLSIAFMASHQTEERSLIAVRQCGMLIKRIEHITRPVSIAAVTENGIALNYILPEEQDEEICIAAVRQNGFALKYVSTKTEEILLEAVRQNGLALKLVPQQIPPHPIIYLDAVRQNGIALKHVIYQTNQVCMAAVRQNGFALKYVKHQTNRICLAAVLNYPPSIDFVLDKTYVVLFIIGARLGLQLI